MRTLAQHQFGPDGATASDGALDADEVGASDVAGQGGDLTGIPGDDF
jgi:hypothetical protein